MTAPNAGGWYPVDSTHSSSYTPHPHPHPHPHSHPHPPPPPPPQQQQQQWQATTTYTTFDISAPQASPRWPGSISSSSGGASTSASAGGASAPASTDLLLVSLAESYLEAAHAGGYRAAARAGAGAGGGEEEREYYALVATGLRCFEAALGGGGRLQPRMEALVRLRYAGVLHEETENGDEAEGALNKGIMLAQRNSLTDLKHRMQHLLARIMLRTTPKASLKMLNTCITESETLDMPHHTYSFRFLRVSMLTDPSSPIHDIASAITTLQKISNTAHARRDLAIFALANLMEAMISIQAGTDGVEAAQRALAKANSIQTEADEAVAQLAVLRQVMDIVCSLMLGRTAESEAKMKVLHHMLDSKERWAAWAESGEFAIPVNPPRLGRPVETLRFTWLTKDDVFVVGYFISGLCKFQKNVDEAGKAERFLQEGLRSIDRLLQHHPDSSSSSSSSSSTTTTASAGPSTLVAATEKNVWRQTLRCYIQLYHTFLLCVRTEWDGAIKGFNALRDAFSALPTQPPPLSALILYLQATIYQGTNALPLALSCYAAIAAAAHPPDSELALISALNSVLILRGADPARAEAVLAGVEKACGATKNGLLKAAYTCVRATERGELVKTKNWLSVALQLATQCANQQMTYIVLNFMCQRFFTGVVSEQAEKSARAALQNAMRGRDGLWSLMGGEMYADCLARKGNEFDAMRQRHVNEEMRSAVLANLTRHQQTLGEEQKQQQQQQQQRASDFG
ncbi:cohesin loading factor [Morchella snyderi]|nr:cohesin loading factor [Morchella snyderi]